MLEGESGKAPDLLIHGGSSSIALETEFAPASTVEADALSRLGKKLTTSGKRIEHAVACRFPASLKFIPQSELEAAIAGARFEFKTFVQDTNGDVTIWPTDDYCCGFIDDLVDAIEALGLSDTFLERTTDMFETSIKQVEHYFVGSDEGVGRVLYQEPCAQTNRMAAAIVANALMFHMSIESHPAVPRLSALVDDGGSITLTSLFSCWNLIINEINYWPIFRLAANVLHELPTTKGNDLINQLYQSMQRLWNLGAHRMNDLSGRMFQKLIVDRHFLATFYTLPVSATLIAELVAERLGVPWHDKDAVTSLRIADWACGTGTLIGAMYQSVLRRVRKTMDDETIHEKMIEDALFAFDVMPAATHLATSTLASAHAGTPFFSTQVVTMPYGETQGHSEPQIGSLELIGEEGVRPLFSLSRAVHSGGKKKTDEFPVGDHSVDVVIMNPPFTRPTNHEKTDLNDGVPIPSFAGFSTSEDEQRAMSHRLKVKLQRLRRERESRYRRNLDKGKTIAANGNAGLGTNFIDLAHSKLSPNGVLALVLPFTFVQGSSWAKARALIETEYRDVLILSIAKFGKTDRSFSADTGMAEVIVVATKRCFDDDSVSAVRYVNLTDRPKQEIEAILLARQIQNQSFSHEQEFSTNTLKFGGAAAVRNISTLAHAMIGLTEGRFALPHGVSVSIPMTQLGKLGTRGLLSRDLVGGPDGENANPRGPFRQRRIKKGEPISEYPVLWHHDAKAESCIVVKFNRRCDPKPKQQQRANEIWHGFASRLHLTIDFQLNSQALAACVTSEKTLGGRAWPNFVLSCSAFENACLLWFNSTVGLMTFWWFGTRTQQGRATVSLSRHVKLPCLDPRQLTQQQLDQFDELFKQFEDIQFLPANEAYRDPNRQKLDATILVGILGLPEKTLVELDLLRKQWCSEPSVHGGKSTRLS